MSKKILAIALLLLLTLPASGQPSQSQSTPMPPSFSYPPPDNMTVKELFAVMNERDRAINQRFELQDKAVNAALAAAKEAVTAALVAAKEAVSKAEFAAEKRFDAVNEFRSTLRDQQATLSSKTEVDIRFKAIDEKLAGVIAQQLKLQGGSEANSWIWLVLVGSAGLVMTAGALYMNSRKSVRR